MQSPIDKEASMSKALDEMFVTGSDDESYVDSMSNSGDDDEVMSNVGKEDQVDSDESGTPPAVTPVDLAENELREQQGPTLGTNEGIVEAGGLVNDAFNGIPTKQVAQKEPRRWPRVSPGKGKSTRVGQKTKRHRKFKAASISNSSYRRLLRRGGVKRVAKDCYETSHQALREFLENALAAAVLYMEHGKRKTITKADIVMGLKNESGGCPVTLYGYV